MSAEANEIINGKTLEEIQDGSEIDDSNALFAKDSVENSVDKEGRVIRKAKRLLKGSPNGEKDVLTVGGAAPSRVVLTKNSRRSRNGFGRGLPKKGGAGGKGVWGAPGSELMASDAAFDENDPNYDSDDIQEGGYIVEELDLEIADEDVGRVVEPLLLEYLQNGIATEVEVVLKDVNLGPNKFRVVEIAVSLAMEKHDAQRELVSRLLLFLVNHDVLCVDDVVKAFEHLLNNLADITLDTPNAPTLLGQFIARAVANECLPESFVVEHATNDDSDAKVALNKAEVLLKMNNGLTRLENVWGVGDGSQSYLSSQMVMLVKEYLVSADAVEATRCLMELDVPHYHHELVYQAIKLAIEEYREHAIQNCAELLKSLTASNIVTPDQLDKGIQRLLADMADISIDVPAAYNLLEMISNLLLKYGVIKETLIKDSPLRGRKRFVSEGDGGRFKYN